MTLSVTLNKLPDCIFLRIRSGLDEAVGKRTSDPAQTQTHPHQVPGLRVAFSCFPSCAIVRLCSPVSRCLLPCHLCLVILHQICFCLQRLSCKFGFLYAAFLHLLKLLFAQPFLRFGPVFALHATTSVHSIHRVLSTVSNLHMHVKPTRSKPRTIYYSHAARLGGQIAFHKHLHTR